MKQDYFLGLSEEGFHRIAYTEWGPSLNLPPLICVHGLTRNSRDFDYIADYFSQQDFKVYCPDIVGRGDSDWLKNPFHYTYEQYMADMNALIARTQVKEVNWLGTSMGGLIGLGLAALPNTPIKRLVLNDIGPQIPLQGLRRLAEYAGNDPVFSSLEEAKTYFKKVYAEFGDVSEKSWQHLTENSVREIAPGKFVTKLDPRVKTPRAKSKLAWQNPLKALEGALFDINLWRYWQKVSCPVLVVHGARSDILTSAIIEKMRKTHVEMEVITVENAGHAPLLEDEALIEKITHWLSK